MVLITGMEKIVGNPNEANPVSDVAVYNIIEKVRSETDLSHNESCRAVSIVFEELIPLLPSSVRNQLVDMLAYFEIPFEAPESIIDHTNDMTALRILAKKLQSVKNDSQQRSWELFEDETAIVNDLKSLNSILKFGDSAICRKFLTSDEFLFVNCLVEYYQMEVRWPIRRLLLTTFSIMCSVHKSIYSVLLSSVLPLELSRDIEQCADNIERVKTSIDIMTEILSTGERMLVTHLDNMGEDFIICMLDLMIKLNIPENVVHFILTYNLQFSTEDVQSNPVINALLKCQNTKMFTETLLFLLNRGEIQIHEEMTDLPNPMLKLCVELFSSESTASLFYTNDIEVLVGIVVRQLTDLSPENKEREQWIILVKEIVLNCSTNIFKVYVPVLLSALNRIVNEDATSQKPEVNLVIQKLSQIL